MRRRIKIPRGLYGITAEEFSLGRKNIDCVKEMIEAGIKIIQYRDKKKSLKEKLKEAQEIKELCHKNNVIFIVNDHVDIAMLVNADGVHVGQDDMPPREIRKLIGDNKIIGLSTHSSIQGEKACEDINVDYIGVGPIYPTTTKNTKAVGLEYLNYVEENLNIPYVAIGGIKENNIKEVLNYGTKRLCLVSEIVGAENIKEKVKKLEGLLKNNNDKKS